jgi:Asp-tRNA(Asn)/Glu-tRNA(Gln) amidotransferase A subunit family amidase
MLGVIAGYDELDPSTADTPVPDYSSAFKMQASKLRLGVPRTPFFEGLDPEIAKAVETAIEVLRKLTAAVGEITLPPTSIPIDEIYATVRGVEFTPTTRNGSRSPRKSIRQPLARGSCRIPRMLKRRLM